MPTRDEAPEVAVYARSPVVRAGLRDLLRAAGLDVVAELGPGMPLPECDAVVIDAANGSRGEEADPVLTRAAAEGVPAVLLVDALPAVATRPVTSPAVEGRLGRAWLRRESSEDEIGAAVRAVLAGLIVIDPALEAREPPAAERALLTERERQVLELLPLGLTNRAIALELGVSEHTAKFHVGAVLAKLGAQSRAEAVSIAVRQGLLAL